MQRFSFKIIRLFDNAALLENPLIYKLMYLIHCFYNRETIAALNYVNFFPSMELK